VSEEKPAPRAILGSNGKPIAAGSTNCPSCGAAKEKRINSAGFGPPIIVCGVCGWFFQGETEP